MKKHLLPLALAAALLVSALVGCAVGGDTKVTASPTETAAQRTKQTVTGFYFDTVINMTIYWQDDSPLTEALQKCAYYEGILSKTVEGSDVWNINHSGGQRVQVSEDTRDIIEKALEYAKLSDGAFDITIEPCVALWDFTDKNKAVLPDAAALAAAAAKVDYTKVDVNDDGVQLGEGQTIDLGAIAKGYIADRISDLLKGIGVESGLLNFGGNVQAIGNKPDGTPWNIGIQDPRGAQSESIAVMPTTDAAVVTSGIYERGFDIDGVRYHHLLDTSTGYPIQNDLAGVSIFVSDSFDGDALSTTLFALGEQGGLALAAELDGVEAMFVTREDQVSYTPGLEGKLTLLETAPS